MKRRITGGVLAALMVAMALAGCGSSAAVSKSEYEPAVEADYAMAEEAMVDNGYGMYSDAVAGEVAEMSSSDDGGVTANADPMQVKSNRKLVTRVSMSLETEAFDLLTQMLEDKAAELGGYVEYSDIYDNSSYSTIRRASYTFRIPAKNLDVFLNVIGDDTVIKSRSRSTEDVTLNYVDMESHVKALEAEEEALRDLMTRAEDVDTILAIQNELTYIRYEKESYQSQLRVYDNEVDYSTVSMDIREAGEEEVEEPGGMVLGVIILILATLIIIAAIVILIVFLVKRGKKKSLAKKQAAQAAQAAQNAQVVSQAQAVQPQDAGKPQE